MSVREALNSSPRLAAGITAGVVSIVILLIVWQGCSARGGPSASGEPLKAFFTVDDGLTYFEDRVTRIPPYEKDGKTVYRARVVQCGTGKLYVLYVEKYGPQDKQRLEERLKDPKAAAVIADFLHGVNEPGVLVKRPLTGDKNWVAFSPETAKQYNSIVQAKCPDGSQPRPVLPR